MFVICVVIFVVMKIDIFCLFFEFDDKFLKLGFIFLLFSE